MNQLYFLYVGEVLARRNALVQDTLDPEVVTTIENCLRTHNRYVEAYKTMEEELRERRWQNVDVENIVIGITREPVINVLAARHGPNWRPARSDIAAIFRGTEPSIDVDPESNGTHQELKLLNPMVDSMVYPQLFPCRDNGYTTGVQYNAKEAGGPEKPLPSFNITGIGCTFEILSRQFSMRGNYFNEIKSTDG